MRMPAIDAAWWHMEHPTNLMMITGVMWFDDPIAMDRLVEVVQTRLVDRYPRFRQRVVEHVVGRPSWEDDPHFVLSSHLHHIALPDPGDQGALQALASDRMSTPLDRARPLWQMELVDGLGEGCAILVRIHHCIADGVSLARVLLSLADQDGAPHPQHTARRRGWSPFLGSWWTPVDQVTTAARLLTLSRDPSTPLKGPLHIEKHASWTEPLDLSRVKAIGHAHHATVNDVLLAALSGAMRSHLQATGAEVDQIRAMVPVNLRPLDEPVPEELGNQFSIVLVPLAVGLERPLERLEAVKDEMDTLKSSQDAAVAWGILNAIGMTPRRVEDEVVKLFASKASLVATNVPGPRAPIRIAGQELSGMLFWVPQAGKLGLGVSILSYAGTVRVGVAADKVLVPDLSRMIAAFGDELDALARI